MEGVSVTKDVAIPIIETAQNLGRGQILHKQKADELVASAQRKMVELEATKATYARQVEDLKNLRDQIKYMYEAQPLHQALQQIREQMEVIEQTYIPRFPFKELL